MLEFIISIIKKIHLPIQDDVNIIIDIIIEKIKNT
jgi:hypothetical protein